MSSRGNTQLVYVCMRVITQEVGMCVNTSAYLSVCTQDVGTCVNRSAYSVCTCVSTQVCMCVTSVYACHGSQNDPGSLCIPIYWVTGLP